MSSSTIDFSTMLKRKPDMVAANIDGDVVMMDVDQGQYYGISGVGSRVWELLEESISIVGITEVICREYETDPATCRNDITKFINELIEIGLIETNV